MAVRKKKQAKAGRTNRGGKSYRVDVVISPELSDALQQFMRVNKITQSTAVRQAIAQYVGRAELAEETVMGRPRKTDQE